MKPELLNKIETAVLGKLTPRLEKAINDILTKKICKRCTNILTSEIEQKNGFCDKCFALHLDQLAHEREERKLRLTANIYSVNREIEFKNAELTNGICETRTMVTKEDGTTVILEGFVRNPGINEHPKPGFLIRNEIDQLKANITLFERQLDAIKKAEEENANKSSSDGDQGKTDNK